MQKMPDPRNVPELRVGDLTGKENRVLRVDDGIFLTVHDNGFALDFSYIDCVGQFADGKNKQAMALKRLQSRLAHMFELHIDLAFHGRRQVISKGLDQSLSYLEAILQPDTKPRGNHLYHLFVGAGAYARQDQALHFRRMAHGVNGSDDASPRG